MSRLRMIIFFTGTIAALVLALKLLSWLPLAIEKGTPRSYRSIESVRAELKPGRIFLPSYFPQYLKWPPSEIYAGRHPSFSLLMHFSHQATGDIILAVSQTGQGTPEIKSKIEPSRVVREEGIVLKGRRARLFLAVCENKEPCNKVSWVENGSQLTVIIKDSAVEAVKIAESMVPE